MQKRQLISMFLVVIAIVTLLGCNNYEKPDTVSDEVYEAGVKALDNADEYLDGTLSGEDASSRILSAYNLLDDDLSGDDFLVSHGILMLQVSLSHLEYGISSKSDVLEERNDLAEAINQKVR